LEFKIFYIFAPRLSFSDILTIVSIISLIWLWSRFGGFHLSGIVFSLVSV